MRLICIYTNNVPIAWSTNWNCYWWNCEVQQSVIIDRSTRSNYWFYRLILLFGLFLVRVQMAVVTTHVTQFLSVWVSTEILHSTASSYSHFLIADLCCSLLTKSSDSSIRHIFVEPFTVWQTWMAKGKRRLKYESENSLSEMILYYC